MNHLRLTVTDPPAWLRSGWTPSSRYAELFWLPTVGPSSLCLGRRFELLTNDKPHDTTLVLDARELARMVGLGAGMGNQGPLNRTLVRMADFHLVYRESEDQVMFRRLWPSLTDKQVHRLPEMLQHLHETWSTARHVSGDRR